MDADIKKIQESQVEPVWDDRMKKNADLKIAAARATINERFISRFDHIFIDCGSTFVYLAEEIFSQIELISPITIYTTNVEVLRMFLTLEARLRDLVIFRVIGGSYIPHHQSFDGFGFSMPELPNKPFFDRAFIGVCPIDSQLRVRAIITDVVKIKQLVIRHSSEVVLVCDEEKFTEAPPNNKTVGQLLFDSQNTLLLSPDDAKQVRVPTNVIIGVSQQNVNNPYLGEFLNLSKERGLIEKRRVILARP